MAFIAVRRFAVLVVLALTFAATAAQADVEKFMKQCDGKMCPFFRASVVIPEGWVEDEEATDYFKAVFLLPKDVEVSREATFTVSLITV